MIIEFEDSKKSEFDKIEFNSEENIFCIKNKDNSIELNFNFISNEALFDFEGKNFQFFFLQNHHLNAENDVFQIYIKEDRIGWIFPIQTIINLENDFSNNKFFNKYRYITYKNLLSKINPQKKLKLNNDNYYSLIDLYEEDLIIFCVSNETLQKELNIDDFIPSLANYGYFLYSNIDTNSVISKNDLINQNKGIPKIKIQESKININEHNYLSNIYKLHLKNTSDKTLKFFLLYQVIEFLIEKKFEIIFEAFLTQYNQKSINKNDFKEKLNEHSRERKIIKKLLSEITLDDDLKTNFIRDAKLFLDNFTIYEKTELGDYIYDIRNLIIHRYRDVDVLDSEKTIIFESITNQLERIVNDCLINYNH